MLLDLWPLLQEQPATTPSTSGGGGRRRRTPRETETVRLVNDEEALLVAALL